MPKDLNGAQTGVAPSSPLNNPRPNNVRGRNVFPQSYKHLTTERYGEYSPFFWAKCERGDVQPLHARHSLHTYTLKSPMVSDVKMKKTYTKVPMQAIYSRNWEKMFTIPTQGDDIPYDNKALFDVRQLIDELLVIIADEDTSHSFRDRIASTMLLETICSHGSLFEKFNMHLNYKFNGSITSSDAEISESSFYSLSIDRIVDLYFYPYLVELGKDNAITKDGVEYFVAFDNRPSTTTTKFVSGRRFIEILRSRDFDFASSWDDLDSEDLPAILMTVSSGYNSRPVDLGDGTYDYSHLLNIEPIIAYQLSCAQFATNDFVDFVYSADLYRQNMQSLYLKSTNTGLQTFLYNGITCLYDIFSYANFSGIMRRFPYSVIERYSAYDYFFNLFSFVPSLRFGDYFTGGKPQPLAVGEYSAAVNGNEVSAIDITKSIQMQRLLNRVNMVGRKLGDYLAGIFGGRLPEAEKDVPVFLAHQEFNIGSTETDNTGDLQFSTDPQYANITTSNLRAGDDRFAFEIEIDEPCYILGMTHYESLRVYSKTMDRFAFHHDRYDDFIPEQQYIGDQDIKLVELDSSTNIHDAYAYCLRYMEYKQRVSYASGGFVENLPSWAFITDNSDGNPAVNFIEPDFIRSSPSEFDRFYKSLNGYSLGSYFHFIVSHTLETSPVRMMEYTPEILK